MAINFGDILGGLGAAYGGTAQQYAQGIQQREQGLTEQKRAELEARQRAMYEDANTAFGFLSNPELNYEQRADNIIRLAEDRLDALSNYPDADPSDTLQVLDLANQMREGTDPTAVTKLAKILAPAYQIYKQRYAPQQEQERGVVVDGNVVNPMTGDLIYAAPPAGETVFEASPGITRYRNGVAVQYSRDGKRQVIDDLGNVVTGEAARSAIQSGIESGVVEAGQIAAEQVQGRGSSERAQSIINNAVDAIGQFPVLTNAIGLLDEVNTGGLAAASIKAKSLFGIESGDEGELSYLLATNVLQQLRPIFGAAFTASEGERLTSISASIGRSPETNRRLLGEALRIARSAAERGLYRAQDANDDATVRELENALNELYQFESDASTMQGAPMDMGNPDLFNRADEIVSGSLQ
jgi:hypothetical protein